MNTQFALLARFEILRLVRNRANGMVLLSLLAALLCGAWFSGQAARELRAQASQQATDWSNIVKKRQQDAVALQALPTRNEQRTLMAAFQFARDDPAPSRLEPGGGLVLSVGQFELLSPSVRVALESRYSDGRKSDVIANPLLQELGLPDFSTLVLLLTPLAVIALAYGLLQEERECGTWRLVCMHSAQPYRVIAMALGVRWLAVSAVVAVASLLAFGLDPGSTGQALATWLAAATGLAALWCAIAALFCFGRVSAAACAAGLLSLWLLANFAIPVALAWAAERVHPMPSRLTQIVELRLAQQEAEVHSEELLAQWYQNNPSHSHPSKSTHTWPVSFIPRYLSQDETMRPLMYAFDQARARQFEWLQPLVWLAPTLALSSAADQLAGIDAPRYAAYVASVNQFEDAWRDFFVPKIMSYQGLAPTQFTQVPVFHATSLPVTSPLPSLAALWGSACALILVFFAFCRRSGGQF